MNHTCTQTANQQVLVYIAESRPPLSLVWEIPSTQGGLGVGVVASLANQALCRQIKPLPMAGQPEIILTALIMSPF